MGWWLADIKRSLLCCVLWVYNYESHEAAAGSSWNKPGGRDCTSETLTNGNGLPTFFIMVVGVRVGCIR